MNSSLNYFISNIPGVRCEQGYGVKEIDMRLVQFHC